MLFAVAGAIWGVEQFHVACCTMPGYRLRKWDYEFLASNVAGWLFRGFVVVATALTFAAYRSHKADSH